MKKVIAIVGARPQFIKHVAFQKAATGKLQLKTIHTGQHYDANMSAVFFEQLNIAKPEFQLQIGSDTHGKQTAKMMIEIEQILNEEKPHAVLVYGDTNSTLAGALVASKMHIPVIHIEAGLRSYNKLMPEEINRVLTDHISTLLFVPSEIAVENLAKEGITTNVFEVGDIMKDMIKLAEQTNLLTKPIYKAPYYYTTIHRPSNTDTKARLLNVLEALNKLDKKVVFALHPRTANKLTSFNIEKEEFKNIAFIAPQSYFNNLNYVKYSEALLTDSGGMQKEAYWLQKKCITLRKETEWIETLESNNNQLIWENLSSLQNEINIKSTSWNGNLYGNGNSAARMVDLILKCLN